MLRTYPRPKVARIGCMLFACFALQVGGISPLRAQLDHERDPILYSKRTPTDRVANLKSRMELNATNLSWDSKYGYLKSLLEQLQISTSSQTLVFSKTSLQAAKVSPQNPRAIYFTDDLYIGWIPQAALIEIAAVDSELGTVFYTVQQQPVAQPEIRREISRCVQCHASTHTRRVPGTFVRSVFCDSAGQPLLKLGSFITTDRSPFKERWGGWYVTGTTGNQLHLGNRQVIDSELNPDSALIPALDQRSANRTELGDLLDVSKYLTPHSDIVALMVLEHQTAMQNLLTTAGHIGRIVERDAGSINDSIGLSEQSEQEMSQRLDAVAEQVVSGLLQFQSITFSESISGTSNFAEEFQSMGPCDQHGRSLRELDLRTRLFSFPCSYLIYSPQFNALPNSVLLRVKRRLAEILSAPSPSLGFEHLTDLDRQNLLELLRSTGIID